MTTKKLKVDFNNPDKALKEILTAIRHDPQLGTRQLSDTEINEFKQSINAIVRMRKENEFQAVTLEHSTDTLKPITLKYMRLESFNNATAIQDITTVNKSEPIEKKLPEQNSFRQKIWGLFNS